MFVTISYVPSASGNRHLFVHIFKLSKSNSNVCFNTSHSTYKWKWAFILRKLMQVPPVSAVNSADLYFCAMLAYASAQL